MPDYSIDCTGDVVVGDAIRFSESVFFGSYRKPQFVGDRFVEAVVTADSYGAARQQHTFTLAILASTGIEPLAAGTRTTRKGRNIYRNGCHRSPWADESTRRIEATKKHERGDAARAVRDARREMEG